VNPQASACVNSFFDATSIQIFSSSAICKKAEDLFVLCA
jgi:hypothetical protein